MEDFNVVVNICECIIDNCCCKNTSEREVTVTNTSQQIMLCDNFVINIVRVSETFFTILIQNGTQIIIRNIFTSYPMSICLPASNCTKHIIKIGGNIISP